jgi:hypothetical protein
LLLDALFEHGHGSYDVDPAHRFPGIQLLWTALQALHKVAGCTAAGTAARG